MKKLLLLLALFLIPFAASAAVCPVCAVAVGGLLIFFESIGIPDIVFPAIWSGAMTLILVFWTARWMNKRRVKSAWWYFLMFVAYYAMMFSVYFINVGDRPLVAWGERPLFGIIDQFLFGAIFGTVVLWFADRWNARLRARNGGKSYFPFQKVIVPVGMLLAATGVMAAILYL